MVLSTAIWGVVVEKSFGESAELHGYGDLIL